MHVHLALKDMIVSSFVKVCHCHRDRISKVWHCHQDKISKWDIVTKIRSQSETLSPRWNLFIIVLNPRLSAASRCRWPFLHCWTKCQERNPLEREMERNPLEREIKRNPLEREMERKPLEREMKIESDHLMISPLQYSIPWNWQRFGSLRWLRENHNGCFIWIKHVWLEKQYILGKVKTKNYQRQETCKTCSGPSLWWRGPCLCKPYNMRS